MSSFNYAISGAIFLGYWAIGLFFFRFRRRTHDAFFGYFGCAFWLLTVERVLLILGPTEEVKPYVYSIRLVAFLFILYAIYHKNRDEKQQSAARRDADSLRR